MAAALGKANITRTSDKLFNLCQRAVVGVIHGRYRQIPSPTGRGDGEAWELGAGRTRGQAQGPGMR